MHGWAHKHKLLLVFYMCGCHHWWCFLYWIFLSSIQERAIGRHSRSTRNFLSRCEEKEIILAKGWCMKGSNRSMKNIWSSHRDGFLGQLRECWICLSYAAMKHWTTCIISTIWPWHTGERIVGNILMRGFGKSIILICYVWLSSQGMSSRLDVRQGRSGWRISCILGSNDSCRWKLRRRRD
jgi:hypothetical protein